MLFSEFKYLKEFLRQHPLEWIGLTTGVQGHCRPSGGVQASPNLDFLCVWQSDVAPFCENYARLYFDARHLEKR